MLLRSVSSKLFFNNNVKAVIAKNPSIFFIKPSYNIFRAMSTTTMKAVTLSEYGGADKLLWTDISIPKIDNNNDKDKDSIVVKNHTTGVNYIDTYFRSGLYKFPEGTNLPTNPLGREGAGEVVEVGSNVKDFKVGDRVVYLGEGSYAEYTKAPAKTSCKIREGISYEDSVAVSLQALTAWTMVRDGYAVKKGDTILVHAAAGGVGLLLCQMLHYLGATVIASVRSEEKAQIVKKHGADHVIIYSKEDFVERVKEITNGLGCHAVLDSVGKDTFMKSIACTRRLGTLISYGNASGPVDPIAITCLTAKNLKLMRPQLYAYMDTKEEAQKWWNEVFDLLKNNVIKTNVYKIYPLEDVKQAHIDIESGKTSGKLLLQI